MSRNISCCNRPFFSSIGIEAVECSGSDVVFGVGDEKFFCFGIYSNAVGNGNFFFRTIRDEVTRDCFAFGNIVDGIRDGVTIG